MYGRPCATILNLTVKALLTTISRRNPPVRRPVLISTGESAKTSRIIMPCSHPLAADPDTAWEFLSAAQTYCDVTPLRPDVTPLRKDRVRFVFISDTHCRTEMLRVPEGDVLLHGGDFTKSGDPREVIPFNEYLSTLPHPIKLVIAGNHELAFDLPHSPKQWREQFRECGVEDPRELLTNCTYLEDQLATVHGITVYGAPWAPKFREIGSFIAERGPNLAEKWWKVPDNTDILITHCPPLGRGDLTRHGRRAGCVDLLLEVQNRIKPKFHLFGHIHEGYGMSSDGVTTFINGAHCAHRYVPTNQPIAFDLPLPSHIEDKSDTTVTIS